MKHSASLILVWRVAEFEARQAKASTIEPTHLLLGLCKVVDLDLPTLIAKDSSDRDEILEELLREIRKLRTVFREAGLDAKKFRRRFRRTSMERWAAQPNSEQLHRSPAAREVFAEAEKIAQVSDATVYPIHLLYATLLALDADRDELLREFKIDRKRLVDLVKSQVISRADKPAAIKSNSRIKWN